MNNNTWTKLGLVALLSLGLMANANAGSREQAKRIHERIAGVPPSDTVLQDMQDMIDGVQPGGAAGAADLAMDNVNFYNVTLKNFAAPWTNREQSVFVPLNDYIATVIGMVRDGEDFSTLLSANRTYVGRSGVVPTAPSTTNNQHYIELEANNINLRDELQPISQSTVMGIPSEATAGVMTSRAASEAFFVAGTNRAMFRFTLLNHMCNDMEQMHDTRLAPDRIRQDVSRSPGGDSRLFLNNCVGCHTGMDPLAGAFAYYDFNETSQSLVYDNSQVHSKYFNNDLNFPQGYRTTDDSWENRWRVGQNSYLGFDPAFNGTGTGNGAKSLGVELGKSQAFASCQVRKVFKTICLREPENAADRTAVGNITATFTSTGYDMKQVFADTAVHCMGQ
ncbi:MAG: hypothetical protein ACR2QL_06765 [Woeseiaceae bacterium]